MTDTLAGEAAASAEANRLSLSKTERKPSCGAVATAANEPSVQRPAGSSITSPG
jgi:hypothetical protein